MNFTCWKLLASNPIYTFKSNFKFQIAISILYKGASIKNTSKGDGGSLKKCYSKQETC